MIESSQRIITINRQGGEGINPAINRHFELQIKTLQIAPRRDADNLQSLLKAKEREKKLVTIYIEDTQRLATEVEMLRAVFYLVGQAEEETDTDSRNAALRRNWLGRWSGGFLNSTVLFP
jgi:hypothetical protein